MTSTSPALIFLPMMALVASSSESNTRAGPRWTIISGATAAFLTTAPSGARLPKSRASPPVAEWAVCLLRITSLSSVFTPARFSPTVFPVTVMDFSLSCPLSSAMTAGMPPARSRSSMKYGPPGRSLHRYGVRLLISSIVLRGKSMPPSWATALRCKTVLVLPPRAISTVKALQKES